MQQCSLKDHLQVCALCLIGLGATLLPIAKRTDRDVKTNSKVYYGHRYCRVLLRSIGNDGQLYAECTQYGIDGLEPGVGSCA